MYIYIYVFTLYYIYIYIYIGSQVFHFQSLHVDGKANCCMNSMFRLTFCERRVLENTRFDFGDKKKDRVWKRELLKSLTENKDETQASVSVHVCTYVCMYVYVYVTRPRHQ